MFSSKKKYSATQTATDAGGVRRVSTHWLNFFQQLKWLRLTPRDNVHPIRARRSGSIQVNAAARAVAQKNRRNASLVAEAGVRVSPSHAGFTLSSVWCAGIVAVILLAIGLAYVAPKWLAQFPIRQVQFSGISHYVAQEQIKAAVEPYIGSGFFLANLAAIQQSVGDIPWVDTARVTRKWPEILQVAVVERVPIAIWNGEYLISNKGELFKPEKMNVLPAALPSLSGPLSQSWLIMNQYQLISGLLKPQQLTIKRFSLSPYLSWEMTLNNGVILRVDRDHSLDKIKQFLQLYPRLKPLSNKIAYVDLRYQKGAAVGWKK